LDACCVARRIAVGADGIEPLDDELISPTGPALSKKADNPVLVFNCRRVGV
jgi:hypothetical protein